MQTDQAAAQLAYEEWIGDLIKTAKGSRKERLSRLRGGDGHAEQLFAIQVWWPVVGNFGGLHPEYELRDEKDVPRFIDFAYFAGAVQLAVEIDGFGPHWRDVGRRSFSDHLMRQNQLVLDGWTVLRFAFDDVSEKPHMCRQTLLRFFGKWSLEAKTQAAATVRPKPLHRDILKLAYSCDVLTAKRVAAALSINARSAARHLRLMRKQELLVPAWSDRQIVRGYKLAPGRRMNDGYY